MKKILYLACSARLSDNSVIAFSDKYNSDGRKIIKGKNSLVYIIHFTNTMLFDHHVRKWSPKS